MRRPKGMRVFVLSACILQLMLSPSMAAFDLELRTPGERGSATSLALGLLDGSCHLPHCETGTAGGRLGVAVYGLRPFGLSEVDFAAVCATFPLGESGSGLYAAYQRLQALAYSEQTVTISYSDNLRHLRFQPVLHVAAAAFDGEWVDWALLADLRMTFPVLDRGKISVYLKNPFGLGLRKQGGGCPRAIRIGFGYPVGSRVAWAIETSKRNGQATCVLAGAEYMPASWTAVRAGIRTYPRDYSFGLGIALGPWRFDFSSSYHLELGATYAAGLTYVRR
jgi:hypothetical protein